MDTAALSLFCRRRSDTINKRWKGELNNFPIQARCPCAVCCRNGSSFVLLRAAQKRLACAACCDGTLLQFVCLLIKDKYEAFGAASQKALGFSVGCICLFLFCFGALLVLFFRLEGVMLWRLWAELQAIPLFDVKFLFEFSPDRHFREEAIAELQVPWWAWADECTHTLKFIKYFLWPCYLGSYWPWSLLHWDQPFCDLKKLEENLWWSS